MKGIILIAFIFVSLAKCQSECVDQLTPLVKYKHNFQNLNDLVDFLYENCVSDKICKEKFYQKHHNNIHVFRFLIKPFLSQFVPSETVLLYDPNEILAKIVCNVNGNSLLATLSTNAYSIYKSNSIRNDEYHVNFVTDAVSHVVKINSAYQMTSYQTDNYKYSCGLNQNLIVSNDGSSVNCACEETQNCSDSLHDTNLIYITLALIIVFSLILIVGMLIDVWFTKETYERYKKSGKPDILLRMISD